MIIPSEDTLTVSDHRLGATLAYLGFPCSWTATVNERTRQKHIQFFFERASVRFPTLPDLDMLLKDWRAARLEPHHVMSVAMRAQENYDALIRWQKEGATHALRPIGAHLAWRYEPGAVPVITYAQRRELDHLHLAAALGEIGFQILDIRGTDPRHHLYTLASVALPMLDSGGQPLRYDLDLVIRFSPTPEDRRRLALEVAQPMHPLVIAYNALRCRALLKKQIDAEHARLIIEDGGRQALIGMNASGHVMDHVTAHFKAPPLS
jgi:hypothetical protein